MPRKKVVDLPPTEPELYGTTTNPKPQPRRTRTVIPTGGDELKELQKRQAAVARQSRVGVNVSVRVDIPTYKRMVELAETNHTPVGTIARQTLIDGLAHWEPSFHEGAARTPRLSRTESFQDPAAKVPEWTLPKNPTASYVTERDLDDMEMQESMRLQAVGSALSAPLPQSPTLPPLESDE